IDAPYHDAFLIKYFGKEWLHSNISLLRTLISEKDFNTLLIKIEQPTTIVSHSIFATSTSQKISFDDCIDTINAALKKHPEINKDDKAAQILVLLHEYTKWSLFSTKLYRKEVHNILSNTTLSNQKKISSIIDSIGRINNDPQLQKIFDFIDAQYPNLLEKTVTSVDNIPKKQH
ncbi:MAG: hypothetical protein HYU63_01210, partial [Armatimonadetes bacterium]|nr:hypothetical protein [Armatimonadota bacterium]